MIWSADGSIAVCTTFSAIAWYWDRILSALCNRCAMREEGGAPPIGRYGWVGGASIGACRMGGCSSAIYAGAGLAGRDARACGRGHNHSGRGAGPSSRCQVCGWPTRNGDTERDRGPLALVGLDPAREFDNGHSPSIPRKRAAAVSSMVAQYSSSFSGATLCTPGEGNCGICACDLSMVSSMRATTSLFGLSLSRKLIWERPKSCRREDNGGERLAACARLASALPLAEEGFLLSKSITSGNGPIVSDTSIRSCLTVQQQKNDEYLFCCWRVRKQSRL